MSCDLIVEDGIGALRAALLEDGEVVEIVWLTDDDHPLEAVHLARITDLRPELGGAFADIGEGVTGFLPAASLPDSATLQAGGRMPLQVLSEAGPDKALRLTGRLRAMGRYVTLSAGETGLRPRAAAQEDPMLAEGLAGVTEDHEVRLRIPSRPDLREAIIAEAATLRGRLQAAMLADGAPRRLVEPPAHPVRLLRAAPHQPDLHILVDSRPLQAEIARLTRRWPDLEGRVQIAPPGRVLFDEYGVSDVLDALLAGVVPLPSGGRLRIADTPAATVVDVDSAGAGAGGSAATLRRQVNLEAATAIAALLRQAQIGGLIMVDFLNMPAEQDRKAVQSALQAALARDPAAPQMSPLNEHGVLTITRTRAGPPLRARMLCPGTPQRSLDARGHDLLRAVLRRATRSGAVATLTVAAPPALADWLEDKERLGRLIERVAVPIRLQRLDDPDATPDIRTG